MTENAKEYLVKARTNLINGKEAEAIGSYAVVAIESPDNGEAAFFGAYAGYISELSDFSKGEGSLGDIKTAFGKIEDSLKSAVEAVVKSEGTKSDKIAVIKKFADIYVPMPDYVITNKIVSPSAIEGRVLNLYQFASYIEKGFNSDKEAMNVAILPLKEAVRLQRKYYAYKYDGIKPEDTVARIQKVDASYTMPKKAGCVSFSK